MPYQIAEDSFPYGDNSDLEAASASWSNVNGLLSVSSGEIVCTSPNDCCVRWAADGFPPDQYSEATLTALDTDTDIGLAIRCAAGAATYYGVYLRQLTYEIFRMVAGVSTQIALGFPNLTAPVRVRFEAVGTSLRLSVDGQGVRWVEDATIASGSAGIVARGLSTPGRLDDWAGGSNVANSQYAAVRRASRRR